MWVYGRSLRQSMTYQKPFPAIRYMYSEYAYLDEDEQGAFKAKLQWQEEDKVKKFSEKYRVKDWLYVHSTFPISWTEWIQLDYYLQRAILQETEEVVREREKAVKQREMDFKMEMAKSNSELKFKDISNTNIGRLMGR